MGRKKDHHPTAKQRKDVLDMTSWGLKPGQIAVIIGVCEKTLRNHYKPELELGMPKAISAVSKSAFRQAMSGKNTPMTIFWLKSKAGWNDKPDTTPPQPDKPGDTSLIEALEATAPEDWAPEADYEPGGD